jgi:alpha-glucosidase (family GH31 glycosyl hydrolase)
MRPLFFEEPTNEKLLNEKESYFWGNAFLIKPITKAGVTSTEVYFPKSNNWFDFYTGKKYAAGSTETVAVAETSIPTFVRGGSFVPMIETIQNTTKYSLDNFNLHFYFDDSVKTSTGKLYNDNGETPQAFGKGQFEILNFNSNNNGNTLVLKLTANTGKNYTPTDKNVTIVVHNIKAKRIFINGQETIFKTNNESLFLPVTWKKGTSPEIKIEY